MKKINENEYLKYKVLKQDLEIRKKVLENFELEKKLKEKEIEINKLNFILFLKNKDILNEDLQRSIMALDLYLDELGKKFDVDFNDYYIDENSLEIKKLN